MPIRLAIDGRPPIELDHDHITLGSDPSCLVFLPSLPDVKPKHAVVRLIDGRWIIEVHEAESFFVGGTQPKKAHWISSGDVIRLSESGLVLTIEIPDDKPLAPRIDSKASQHNSPKIELLDDKPLVLASESSTPASSSLKPKSDIVVVSDSDPSLPTKTSAANAKKPVPKPPSSAIIQVPKTPSSANISTTKQPSSTNIPTAKPTTGKAPSSTTIRVPKPPSSTTIQTTKPPSSTTIRTTKSPSGELPTDGKHAAKPRSSDSIASTKGPKRPPSSSQIPVYKSDDDEPAAGLPVLKRLSSYEVPVSSIDDDDSISSWDEAPGPRKRSSDDADIQWIKSIVIRCVAVGLVVLIFWIAVKEV